jgi:PAS domain S-box-containing protein
MEEIAAKEDRGLLQRWRWAPAGWILLLLGATGVLGWTLALPALIQPWPGRAPIRPLGAAALLVLGVGVLALERGRRRGAMVAAVLTLAIGYFAVLQLATGLELGLGAISERSRLFFDTPVAVLDAMPVAAAIGMLLAGGGLALVAASYRSATTGAFLVGLSGATLVALNLALLVGQALGLSQGVQMGQLAGASPQVTVGLLVLGVSLAAWAWDRDWTPASFPAWLPVAVGLATLAAVLLIWRALAQGQRDDHAALLAAVARGTEDQVHEAVGRTTLALWRVAWLSREGVVGSEPWRAEVRGLLEANPGVERVAWVPVSGPLLLYPAPADSGVLQVQLRMQLLRGPAPDPAAADSARLFSLADGAGTLAAAIPRCDLTACDGFLVGLIRVDRQLRPLLGDSPDGFLRHISWRGQTLFGRPPGAEDLKSPVYRARLEYDAMTWDLAVWPSEVLRVRMASNLPSLVLAFGLLVSALLPVTLQLTRTVKSNARSAEQVRLRLALGRAMDRAWSWEPGSTGGTAPGLEASGLGQEIRRGAWTALVHPDDRPRVEAALAAHLDGRTPAFEAQYRLRDESGEWRWRVDRGHVTERGTGGAPLHMLGVSGDVSERRRLDQEHETVARRFRAIFDSAHSLQILLDLEGRVLEANPTVLHLLGPEGRLEQLEGRELWTAPWWPTPERAGRVRQAVERARRGETVTDEAEILVTGREAGRLILDLSIKPIPDAEGRPVQLLVEARDITAARRAEARLREIDTLSTMGRLAARIAHEINNPLAGIQNSFLLLRDAIPPTHPHHAYVGAMEREIGRIAAVTRQLYETYRAEPPGEGGRAGVRTLIADAVALLEQLYRPSRVRILADLDRLPSGVAVPEAVLRQSVYNLVQNAVEVSPPGGTVTVEAAVVDSRFELRVRDEGPGVSGDLRRRILQGGGLLGSVGHADGRGSAGVGLALVRRSLDALGGDIAIGDPPGGGTEFVVRIPLTAVRPGRTEGESS